MLINKHNEGNPFTMHRSEVSQSCPTLCDPMDRSSSVHGIFQARIVEKEIPTQGWNPGLQHCRQTLYRLSHQGSRSMHRYIKLSL